MASPSPSSLSSPPYPYAFAPDIIRAHQKDAYFQGLLTNQLTDLHRRLLGARSAHAWSTESRTLADLLYLCLTTLLGNRTLGEEYCGLIQVEEPEGLSQTNTTTRLPSIQRRAAYIAGSILLPYGLARILPSIRSRIKNILQWNLARAESSSSSSSSSTSNKPATQTWSYRLQSYLLANLGTLTSPAPIHALGLALFYFGGSYYELAKRLTGLRYVFTSRAALGNDGEPSADRAGYELLGVLLVVQMGVQGYLHVKSTLASFSSGAGASDEERDRIGGNIHVSLDEHAYSANNAILLTQTGTPGGSVATSGSGSHLNIAAVTHTPPPASSSSPNAQQNAEGIRYDLANEKTMGWIKGAQQRKCTLCLEELKDPAATQCGHVFCWACIGDWVREKPECPLCRREAMVQHILPLRAC
ncbi:Pex12 amino terminal region-domain-containing protein [Xylariaceae sp. FL0255]|nr:Pex12 amino terminal region-domain-containing protein [Xylariaceae sp. FL0255]